MEDPVFTGIERAIDRWVGLEAGSYGTGKKLSNMWVEQKGVGTPYFPDGARRLIGHIKDQSVFEDCERAQGLSTGDFGSGGLKTVGDLFDHLRPCDPNA